MRRAIEVEIHSSGKARPVVPGTSLPVGRATLLLDATPEELALYLSTPALEDWLSPEEDAAWAEWQPVK